MRFNSQAYDKVFPRTTEVEYVESSVETFKPSENEQDNTVNESAVGNPEPEITDPLLDGEPSTEQGGGADGNGNDGQSDNE